MEIPAEHGVIHNARASTTAPTRQARHPALSRHAGPAAFGLRRGRQRKQCRRRAVARSRLRPQPDPAFFLEYGSRRRQLPPAGEPGRQQRLCRRGHPARHRHRLRPGGQPARPAAGRLPARGLLGRRLHRLERNLRGPGRPERRDRLPQGHHAGGSRRAGLCPCPGGRRQHPGRRRTLPQQQPDPTCLRRGAGLHP